MFIFLVYDVEMTDWYWCVSEQKSVIEVMILTLVTGEMDKIC